MASHYAYERLRTSLGLQTLFPVRKFIVTLAPYVRTCSMDKPNTDYFIECLEPDPSFVYITPSPRKGWDTDQLGIESDRISSWRADAFMKRPIGRDNPHSATHAVFSYYNQSAARDSLPLESRHKPTMCFVKLSLSLMMTIAFHISSTSSNKGDFSYSTVPSKISIIEVVLRLLLLCKGVIQVQTIPEESHNDRSYR